MIMEGRKKSESIFLSVFTTLVLAAPLCVIAWQCSHSSEYISYSFEYLFNIDRGIYLGEVPNFGYGRLLYRVPLLITASWLVIAIVIGISRRRNSLKSSRDPWYWFSHVLGMTASIGLGVVVPLYFDIDKDTQTFGYDLMAIFLIAFTAILPMMSIFLFYQFNNERNEKYYSSDYLDYDIDKKCVKYAFLASSMAILISSLISVAHFKDIKSDYQLVSRSAYHEWLDAQEEKKPVAPSNSFEQIKAEVDSILEVRKKQGLPPEQKKYYEQIISKYRSTHSSSTYSPDPDSPYAHDGHPGTKPDDPLFGFDPWDDEDDAYSVERNQIDAYPDEWFK